MVIFGENISHEYNCKIDNSLKKMDESICSFY